MQIEALIERLEGLNGPDREVDAEICVALTSAPDHAAVLPSGAGQGQYYFEENVDADGDPAGFGVAVAPAYSASLDAAIALVGKVLPADETADHQKSEIRLQIGDFGCNAVVSRDTFTCERSFFGIGKTAPLALLISMFRALAAGGSDAR